MNDSKSPRSRVADHIAKLPKSGIRDFFELVMSMDDVISLGVGEPDFVTPWSIREATIYSLEKGHTSYTSNLGLLALRREVCRYVGREFGVQYDPETECIITVGVSEALDLILRAVLEPGDEVIYHEPCYVSYAPSIAMAHATPVSVETCLDEEFRLTAEAIESKISPRSKVLLLNFPNNPTGASLSWADKQAIAAVAVKHDLLVITDEIYAELTYDDSSPSIASCDGMKERTVFLHGLSKAYAMTGYRIGYACGPAELVDAMMKIHQYSMLCASIIGQEAALEALANSRHHMEAMKHEYWTRRNLCVKRMTDMGLTLFTPRGAFYIFPNISVTGLSSDEFAARLLEEERVAVVPGTAFGACGAGHVRCSYATAIDSLEIAMDRMAAFVARTRS